MSLNRKQRDAARLRMREMFRGQVPTCAYCGVRVYDRVTLDHLVPQGQGGDNRKSNLVVSCLTCNAAKGNRDPIQWCADILDAYHRNLDTIAPQG